MGGAAIDVVIRQIKRNEGGLPTSPKVIMVEGSWTTGDTSPSRIVV